jgi:hypothetical protein
MEVGMPIDWSPVLQHPGYAWEFRHPGATDNDLNERRAFCGRPLPEDYMAFLRLSNGGGLWYQDIWYVRFWRSVDIPSWSAAFGFVPDEMPGALAFADDGGGEGLVFDIRQEQQDGLYPVVAANFVTIGWKEVIPVAQDFRRLMLLRRELLTGTR